jgi:hypothetical protein
MYPIGRSAAVAAATAGLVAVSSGSASAGVVGAGAAGGTGPRPLYVTASYESGHSTLGGVTGYACTASAVHDVLAQYTDATCRLYLDGGLAATTTNSTSGSVTAASAALIASATTVTVCVDGHAHWSDDTDVYASGCTTVHV